MRTTLLAVSLLALFATGCKEAPNGTEPDTEAARAKEAEAYINQYKQGNGAPGGEAAARAAQGKS